MTVLAIQSGLIYEVGAPNGLGRYSVCRDQIYHQAQHRSLGRWHSVRRSDIENGPWHGGSLRARASPFSVHHWPYPLTPWYHLVPSRSPYILGQAARPTLADSSPEGHPRGHLHFAMRGEKLNQSLACGLDQGSPLFRFDRTLRAVGHRGAKSTITVRAVPKRERNWHGIDL